MFTWNKIYLFKKLKISYHFRIFIGVEILLKHIISFVRCSSWCSLTLVWSINPTEENMAAMETPDSCIVAPSPTVLTLTFKNIRQTTTTILVTTQYSLLHFFHFIARLLFFDWFVWLTGLFLIHGLLSSLCLFHLVTGYSLVAESKNRFFFLF